MKKHIISLVLLFSIFFSYWSSYAAIAIEKKVAIKNYILARAELRKNISNAQEYIDELDAFFKKYDDDTEKLEGVLERTQNAKAGLWSNISYNSLRTILNYIEHLTIYTLAHESGWYTPPTPQLPVEPNQYEASNIEALSDMKLLENIIDSKIAGNLDIKDIVWEQIQETSSTGSYFLMGHPNYGNLGLLKDSYVDALGYEFVITVLISTEGEFYQILGYLQKDEDTKTATLFGNYQKPNQYYPVSLFVNPETKAPIVTGDDMNIE